jgi:hypothetical protein
MTKSIIICFFAPLFSFHFLNAQNCNCPPLGPYSQSDANKYQVICEANVLSVDVQDKSILAKLSIKTLFKGQLDQRVDLILDKNDVCPIDINAGERWLIYGGYYQVKSLYFDPCSRSRKYFPDIKADFYAISTGQSYDEELRSVQFDFSEKSVSENAISGRELIKPKGKELIALVAFSLLGFLLIWFIVKRFLK